MNYLRLLFPSLLLLAGPVVFAQPAPQPQPNPPKPAQSDVPDTSDGVFSLKLFYWMTRAHPELRTGPSWASTTPGNLDFPRKTVGSPGVELGFPAGKGNTVRFSYFRMQAGQNQVASSELSIFGSAFDTGDYLSTHFTLQNVKIVYDYLSYPYPPEDTRFRFRLLFGGQYTTINPTIDAPLKTDTTGAAAPVSAAATKWFIYPSLGFAVERALSKHFRVELQATGFALPGRSNIWDAEASAAYRHGKVEFLVEGKAFHFRTSPKQDQFMRATLPGAGIGLRYYP